MDKFDLLLKQLQESEDVNKELDFLEIVPTSIYEEHFSDDSNYKVVKEGLGVDKHRWYETSTTVVEIYGRFLGCQHVSGIFSESMDASDCGFPAEFFEMEKVPSFKYRRKQ